MKTRTRLIFVCFILFGSCASYQRLGAPISIIKHNTSDRAAIDAVRAVSQNHEFSVYEDQSSKGSISFWDNTLVDATPNDKGEYLQPVINMGFDKGFAFRRTIYEVEVSGDKIRIMKTGAETGFPAGKGIPVERDIHDEVAQKTGGIVQKE